MSTIDLDTVQELLEAASPQEALRLKVLHNASVQTFREYKDAPTKGSLANWKAADGELAAEVERLREQSAAAGPGPAAWGEYKDTKVRAEVLRFLQGMGFDVAQRTFYRHCDEGKLKTNTRGLYSRRLVRAYAEHTLRLIGGVTAVAGESSLVAERLAEQVARERINRQRDEIRLRRERGEVIDRESLNLEVAARGVALDAGVRQMINSKGMEWIAGCGGNTEKLSEFTAMFLRDWDELINTFAQPGEFEVVFTEGREAEG